VTTRLSVAYVSRAAARTGATYTNYSTPDPAALEVKGFDVLLTIGEPGKGPADSALRATWSRRPFAVRVLRARDTLVVVPLDSMLAKLRERKAGRPARPDMMMSAGPMRVIVPRTVVEPRAELFTTEGEGRSARARVYVRLIAMKDSAGTRRIESLTGRVLLALKR